MSLPKRHIEIDPSTPFGEVTKFLAEGSGEVEVKSGPELFIVHRAVEAESAVGEGGVKPKPNAVDAMLEFAGSWEGIKEIDDYLEWREKQRELDFERQERLWGE
ncbi:MAG: hypothetical protein ACRDHN_01565 [Thermomicrobiales bacterium]